jgi:hypothetical protein
VVSPRRLIFASALLAFAGLAVASVGVFVRDHALARLGGMVFVAGFAASMLILWWRGPR